MDRVLTADGLVKRYGETTALDGVSLEVDAGEVVAVIGPNGAGKTTLVRCLTGTARPDAGTASVLGEPPSAMDEERVAVLPQDFRPPERLTPRELAGYYGDLYRDAVTLGAVLDAVALEEGARDRRYRSLSGGQQRRACVAATLVNDPDLLFLDEPTTGIDPAGRRVLWDVVASRAEAGAAVVLTTHDMQEAAELADRVALLDGGRFVATGDPAALVERHGGEPALIVDPAGTAEEAAGALADASGAAGVGAPEVTDGALRFEGVASTEIQGVLDRLDAHGVGYDAVTWRQPTLDDVFLELADGGLEEQDVEGRER